MLKTLSHPSSQHLKIDLDKYLKLWKLKPAEKATIKIYGREVKTPRYLQNYGKDYSFSNADHTSLPIPELLQPYLDFVNSREPNWDFNGILVNWYVDGDNYISPHSDNEKSLVKDAPIYLFSFGTTREFIVENKKQSSIVEKHKFSLTHNTMLVMGGECQKYYNHSIKKNKKIKATRVSITIRAFH